jgi:ribosomal protein L6P/L9E
MNIMKKGDVLYLPREEKVLVDKQVKQIIYNYLVDKDSLDIIVFIKGDLGVVSTIFSRSVFSSLEEVKGDSRCMLKCKFVSVLACILFKKKLKEMVYGVYNGYIVDMYFKGLGYRGWIDQGSLYINIGYTHVVKFDLPLGVIAKCRKNHLLLFGVNLEKINDVAKNLTKIKVADPYRGKGVRYVDSEFVLKVGKTR